MTRPSAPRLTADYYTYSTYSARDDNYGGIEPKHEPQEHMQSFAPARREPTSSKNQFDKNGSKDTSSVHFTACIYSVLALTIIALVCFLYYYGIKNRFVICLAGIMGGVVLSSFLMHLAIIRHQPFLCIPFVVMRTLETFISGILVLAFAYATIRNNSEIFIFFLQCTKLMVRLVSPQIRLDLVDATLQFCIIGFCISLTLLSISVYVCRVAFYCTLSIADEVRHRRSYKNMNTFQKRFVGDELYCS
ncbi:unnamed protein product [Caenorhabditis sp. 36 PRJEB53466]|nr:unnamed protein product [Caenorhabditis sp. 36 PRJEB53466]